MRYLVGVVMLMLVNVANAIECQVDGLPWTNVENNNLDVNVHFYRTSPAGADGGKVSMIGFSYLCRHAVPGEFLEIWTRYDGVRLMPSFAHLKSGLDLRGNYLPSPVNSILLVRQPLTNSRVSIHSVPYLVVDSPPNGYVEIPRGSKVFTYALNIQVWRGSVRIKSFQTDINIYARNSLNLNPWTCTINNNNPVEVDFGSVDPLAVGGDISAGTPYRRSVVLNYSCPEAGIDSPIDIKLLGTASSFNSSALATSNPDLAAGLTRLSSLVAPGSSFRTSITNSSGRDTVLFTLFRKTGSLPAAGPFTASGTLVMSVP